MSRVTALLQPTSQRKRDEQPLQRARPVQSGARPRGSRVHAGTNHRAELANAKHQLRSPVDLIIYI